MLLKDFLRLVGLKLQKSWLENLRFRPEDKEIGIFSREALTISPLTTAHSHKKPV